MKILKSLADCRLFAEEAGGIKGFVPTMGALHQGHMSLFKEAIKQDREVVGSIFVNPAQFNNPEDLKRYPRTIEQDLEMLEKAGVAAVFLPNEEMMYPNGFATRIEPGPIASLWEGECRPGHFSGVATVVTKLLNIIQPKNIYLGQKDAQQVAVIRQVVKDLNINTSVQTIPTQRAESGLALSSRNARLSEQQRVEASLVFQALKNLSEAMKSGYTDACLLEQRAVTFLKEHNIDRIDYIACVDPNTFQPQPTVQSGTLVIAAVFIGDVRIIDNITL